LRSNVNLLKVQARKLQSQIAEIADDARRTKEVETELHNLAQKRGLEVNTLLSHVNQNKILFEKMELVMKKQLAEEIVRVVLSSDINKDFTIDKNEVEFLALRLKLKLSTFDIDFNNDKFERLVMMHNTLPMVITTARQMMDSSEDTEELFRFSRASYSRMSERGPDL